MTMLRSVFMLSAASLAVALLGQPALAQTYKFKTIDIPGEAQTALFGKGGSTILAWGISSSGTTNCTLITGTTDTVIADPNGVATWCYGISNAGTVVGYYNTNNNGGPAYGFTYSNGTFTDFSLPGIGLGPTPLAISVSGKYIAGDYYENNEPWGFVLKGGTKATSFQIPGMAYVFPDGINSHGEMSIQAYDEDGNLYCYAGTAANLTELNYPGTTYATTCEAINNNGQVAGFYTDASGTQYGFTYDPATQNYYMINDPDAADVNLLGITNGQTLYGFYQATSGGPWQGLEAKGSFP
jgi:probable HAF family extracellular repeat protein